jgi:23S rRNA (adenine2503-C2)-methyltransferase
MPINKKYPIENLIAFAKKYTAGNRRITFEYALISGVNDSEADAKRLAALLKKNGGIDCHVNLLKLTAGGRGGFAGSSEEVAVKFKETLEARGVVVTIRRSLGADIAAACGQLRIHDLDC